jgi:hypothetical protein
MRWDRCYPLSYQDVRDMLAKRGYGCCGWWHAQDMHGNEVARTQHVHVVHRRLQGSQPPFPPPEQGPCQVMPLHDPAHGL